MLLRLHFLLFFPLLLVAGAEVDFSREVLPVLSDNCFYCHGPDAKHRKANLRLDDEVEAKKVRKGQAAIVPGESGKSGLVARLLSADPEEKMPPPESHKKLSEGQIETLRRWIDEGAKWGVHWAFSDLKRPAVPEGAGHPIDAFVRQRLAREGLEPAPEAEKATLLRRVTLDLTGLPPSAERLAAFLVDGSPEAYEKVVDGLLAAPAYGERMAWDWMEAARYADTNGYQGDNERTMWPWRDWVVRAFNQNLSWDRFTLWQLAGDLLPGSSFEQRLATGFLRNHPINGEGGRIPEENRVDYVMDMAETTGTVWLALTMNCCRCHDHKFDPLLQRDYYSLFAYFNQTPVDGGGGDAQTAPVLAVPTAGEVEKLAKLEGELAELRRRMEERRTERGPLQAAWEQALVEKPSAAEDWRALVPQTVKAKHQELTVLEDQSVLASGPNPQNDTYTVTFQPGAGRYTALRLEALRHESMTHQALARSDSGNFVLTNLAVMAMQPVVIASAEATFEQGDLKVGNAFDKDPRSGWAVYEGRPVDKEHAAVFHFREPVVCKEETVLTVTLAHDSPHVSHNLGRFRLALSENPLASLKSQDDSLRNALRLSAEKRNEAQRKQIEAAWEASDAGLVALQAEVAKLEERRKEAQKNSAKVMVMADKPERRKSFILDHGIYDKPLAEVSAATPTHLTANQPEAPPNRLGLAQWIVSPQNPLPARVAVNRYWQMLFGVGLVKTSEDFGVQAEFPKHPELLDWLAVEFRDSGWDIKRLLKQIVMSKTYRQSSRVTPVLLERDSENRLLARGARFRLPSWMVRDQALAVSGLLVSTMGGPSVRPYQPSGVWEEATFGKTKYVQATGDDLHRRSLYTFWRRIVGPTGFFDTQSRSVCTVKPTRTNTPLHALTTLNDTTFVEAAGALAAQAIQQAAEPAGRIEFLHRRILGRAPTAEEWRILLAALQRSEVNFKDHPEQAKEILPQGASPELAAQTVLALTLLNLDETLTRE